MLNKQQKKFRKEMAAIKKEKGHLYHEVYDNHRPNRQRINTSTPSHGGGVRVVLFVCFAGWMIYQSGILRPIMNQEAISHYAPKQPNMIKGFTGPILAKKEQGCSDYLQGISVISQGVSQTMNDYIKENGDYFHTKEMLSKYRVDLDQIEIIKHGEALREVVVENLAVSAHYVDVIEELRAIRVLHTEADKVRWEQSRATSEQLHSELSRIIGKQKEEVKALLVKYDMGYVEMEDRVEYQYMGDGPSAQ